jgi:MFS family permease
LEVAVARGLIRSHADFRRFWIGQTVSEVGTQISNVAVPLVAVLALHASTLRVSALFALEYLPYLLIGLPAGVWIDRLRRRSILIVTDLICALAMSMIPLAALFHAVSLPLLYGVVFVVGTANVFFGVANQAYLPAVVDREDLVAANGITTASRAVASAAGPTAGAWFVAILTGPIAVIADVASYLCSALFITAIHPVEPPVAARRGMLREVGEGLRIVRRDRLLLTMTLYTAASSTFVMMVGALEIVFLVRTVHVPTIGIGILLGVSSLGSVLGAVIAAPLGRRFGELRALVGSAVFGSLSLLLVPLTALGFRLSFFALGAGMASCGIVAYNVVSISLVQRRCPDRLLGRVFGTMRFVGRSAPGFGALIGGVLGSTIGLRAALAVTALLFVGSSLGLNLGLKLGLKRGLEIAVPAADSVSSMQ